MHTSMLILLFVSIGVLGLLLLKRRASGKMLAYACLNALIAAVGLYILNTTDMLGEMTIPINPVSVMIMAVLGLPGLILLIALKAAVI